MYTLSIFNKANNFPRNMLSSFWHYKRLSNGNTNLKACITNKSVIDGLRHPFSVLLFWFWTRFLAYFQMELISLSLTRTIELRVKMPKETICRMVILFDQSWTWCLQNSIIAKDNGNVIVTIIVCKNNWITYHNIMQLKWWNELLYCEVSPFTLL